MRKFAFVAVALLTGPAFAADLPPETSLPAASVPAWSGCYAGANVGGAGGNLSKMARVTLADGTPDPTFIGSQSGRSAVGGGQFGCDFQKGSWVFGAQGLFDFTDLSSSNPVAAAPVFTITNVNHWLATTTGRIGYTIAPALLLYGRGGAAFVQDSLKLSGSGRFGYQAETAVNGRIGWTAGGGLEWMFMPNLSLSIEYARLDFGTENVRFIDTPGTTQPASVIAITHTADTAMVGIKWHFGAPDR
jgi:outer membrane immunogenic protein